MVLVFFMVLLERHFTYSISNKIFSTKPQTHTPSGMDSYESPRQISISFGRTLISLFIFYASLSPGALENILGFIFHGLGNLKSFPPFLSEYMMGVVQVFEKTWMAEVGTSCWMGKETLRSLPSMQAASGCCFSVSCLGAVSNIVFIPLQEFRTS